MQSPSGHPRTLKTLTVLLVLTLSIPCASASTGLLDYVNAPDASFSWHRVSAGDSPAGPSYIISMTSQTWQGIKWTHNIEFIKPRKCDYPGKAVLIITYGKPGDGSAKMAGIIAGVTGCPVAVLYDIPNQPLFDGLREDALIAHTFARALETRDLTWPLLLPMVKSAVRAMDVIQAFSKSELGQEIDGFVVSGASKRGWTTWLTAAADPGRVKGIVPMVYDNLNLVAQMRHQIECWGAYGEEIRDYTQRGLQDTLETNDGKALAQLVDPWSYQDKLTMPKLILNGTNDPYWTQDALNIYWDALRGPKFVTYIPNAGHNLRAGSGDTIEAVLTCAAFARAVVSQSPLPRMDWNYVQGNKARRLNITACPGMSDAKLWTATSDTLDFRGSTWRSSVMTRTEQDFTARFAYPVQGYQAVYGSVSVPCGDRQSTLSTQMCILSNKGPVRPLVGGKAMSK